MNRQVKRRAGLTVLLIGLAATAGVAVAQQGGGYCGRGPCGGRGPGGGAGQAPGWCARNGAGGQGGGAGQGICLRQRLRDGSCTNQAVQVQTRRQDQQQAPAPAQTRRTQRGGRL